MVCYSNTVNSGWKGYSFNEFPLPSFTVKGSPFISSFLYLFPFSSLLTVTSSSLLNSDMKCFTLKHSFTRLPQGKAERWDRVYEPHSSPYRSRCWTSSPLHLGLTAFAPLPLVSLLNSFASTPRVHRFRSFPCWSRSFAYLPHKLGLTIPLPEPPLKVSLLRSLTS